MSPDYWGCDGSLSPEHPGRKRGTLCPLFPPTVHSALSNLKATAMTRSNMKVTNNGPDPLILEGLTMESTA